MAQALGGGMVDLAVADARGRRGGAAADARGADHPHFHRIDAGSQLVDQLFGAGDHAGDGVADPDGDRRGRDLALVHHIEVIVERGDLVDLGLGQAHLLGQRAQVARGQVAVAVLDQVQVFDQEVAAARAGAQQLAHIGQRLVLDRPALGAPIAPATRNFSVHARPSLDPHITPGWIRAATNRS